MKLISIVFYFILSISLFSQEVTQAQINEYYDLLSLWRAYPDLPGLTELLTEVEKNIGIRKDEVDQNILELSETLYEEVMTILKKSPLTESDKLLSLDLLTQIISMNPENISAINLQDSLLLQQGGNRQFILTSGQRSLFERAQKEYMNGNIYDSYQIIRRLSHDKKLLSYPDFLKLKKMVYNDFYNSLKGF